MAVEMIHMDVESSLLAPPDKYKLYFNLTLL